MEKLRHELIELVNEIDKKEILEFFLFFMRLSGYTYLKRTRRLPSPFCLCRCFATVLPVFFFKSILIHG